MGRRAAGGDRRRRLLVVRRGAHEADPGLEPGDGELLVDVWVVRGQLDRPGPRRRL